MSSFAYIDEARTIRVEAVNCTISDRNKRYYCPEPDCTAHMKLRCVESINAPHFCALKKFPHTGVNCKYDSAQQISARHDEKLFQADDFFLNLSNSDRYSGTNERTIKKASKRKAPSVEQEYPTPIRTVRDLYILCKVRDVNSKYGDIPVKELLCDDRSNFLYTRGINKNRLIECTYHHYNRKKQSIFLKYPLDTNKKNQYTICIHIENARLYDRLLKMLYTEQGVVPSPVVIASCWHTQTSQEQKIVFGDVVSGKQIYAPPLD